MSEAAISTPDIHSGLSSTELIDMALARGEGVLSDTARCVLRRAHEQDAPPRIVLS